MVIERPESLFATIATCDRPDAGVGVIWFAFNSRGRYLLHVLDRSLEDMSAVRGEWLAALFAQGAELARKYRPIEPGCIAWVERGGGLLELLEAAGRAWEASGGSAEDGIDLQPVRDSDSASWPATIDERVAAMRPLVNSGTVVRIESGLRRFAFRGTTTEHLVAQLRRHRPGDPSSAGELLHAFVLGLFLTRGGDRRTVLPPFTEHEQTSDGLFARMAQFLRHPLAPPPPPAPTPGVFLRPGKYSIWWYPHAPGPGRPYKSDGHSVEPVTVVIEGARGERIWHPLPRWGRYVINEQVTYVRDPRVGRITIPTRFDQTED